MKQSMLSENHATPFLDGIAQGVLRYQCCTDCGAPQTLSRYACANCGGSSLQWRDAAGTGTVYAKRGPGGGVIERADSPRYFWLVIACYAALAIAMITIF